MANAICFTVNCRRSDVCKEAILKCVLSDLIPSKIKRFSDSSQTDAILPTLNFRRSDVCI